MFEQCGSAVCSNLIDPETENQWRRTPRRFCSDKCKTDVWAIKRTRELLQALSVEKKKEFLFGQYPTQQNADGERPFAEMKRYQCERFPSFSLGKAEKFRAGYFETEDVVLQSLVESNEWFGIHIVAVE